MARASTDRPRGSLVGLGVALAVVAGCRGDRSPPLSVGPGLRLEVEGGGRKLSLDPAAIVTPPADCPVGAVLERTAEGWRCVLPNPDGEGPWATAAELSALAARVTELEAIVLRLRRCEALEGEAKPPNFSVSPASCLVTEAYDASPFVWTLDAGALVHRGVAAGAVKAYCPLVPRCDGSDRVLSRLEVHLRDPDGGATAAEVCATVYRDWAQPVGALEAPGCNVSSSAAAVPPGVTATLTQSLDDYALPFDVPEQRVVHWLEVTLRGGGAAFLGAEID